MTNEERRTIQNYLSGVKRCIGDRTASEQAELIRQLEEHIHESIRQSPGTPVSDIISQMDPPESFGEADERRPPAESVLGRLTLGQLSLVVMIAGVVIPFLLMALGALIRGNVGSIINVGAPLGIVLVIVALALGIAARKEVTGKVTIVVSSVILALLAALIPVNRVVSGSPEPERSMYRIEAGDSDDSEGAHSE